jgi:SsrA-binding protein
VEPKQIKMIAENKKVKYDYFIVDEYEAGMVLVGTEVKSLRDGRANIKDAYARIQNGEVYLHHLHIGAYPFAYYDNHDPVRPRKLLLHKKEIRRLYGKANEKGFSLVPRKLYFKGGKAKVSIALVKGKRQYDKRQALKSREAKRDLDRIKKEY